jgi:hypothetical protein
MNRAADPYFLAGLAAVLFIFLTCTFVGLSLFRSGVARRHLMRWQSFALFLQVIFLAWLVFTLWGQIDAMRHLPEPRLAELELWTRRTMSVLLVGISTVFASLLTTFGWVRAGVVGNAMRSILWAIPAVKVVVSAVLVSGLLYRAGLKPGVEESIAVGALPAAANAILQPLESVATLWVPICLGMLLVSVVISIGKRDSSQ